MTDALAAVAEPNRRRILQLLASGPRTVGELADHFTTTRSATSQHLAVLREVGLVDADKVGRTRVYRVVPEGLALLQTEIDRFWTHELDRLAADAGAMARARRDTSKDET